MASIAAFEQPAKNAGYLDAAELASILRGELKRAFAGVTFRVRTSKYSMGSSVNINWTDGPLTADVDAVIARYKCEGFDGMTDSRTNSGPIRLEDGRLMRVTSFIFTTRTTSPELRARVTAWFDRRFGGGFSGDREQEIHRYSWRAQIVSGCLVVRKVAL
jgi:hypothetical protein